MARYTGSVCRLCRREGAKLFLKGDRCFGEKCAFARRPVPPGQHGKGRRKSSEYGLQLREKQKVRRAYGIMEKQFLSMLITLPISTWTIKIFIFRDSFLTDLYKRPHLGDPWLSFLSVYLYLSQMKVGWAVRLGFESDISCFFTCNLGACIKICHRNFP